jgi:Lon protease-like protein
MTSFAQSMRERLKYLPIFPLPDTVLIPGALLPLQVVDARHQRLVQDCLASDRLLAVVLLAPPWTDGRLAICRTAGVGYIQSHEELADGRMLVLVEGRLRARILEELPGPEPYLVARAALVEEEIGTSGGIFASTQALRQLVLQLTRLIPDGSGQTLATTCANEDDPGRLSDLVAATLLSDPPQRQRYLEEASVIRRLDFMVGILAQVLRVLGAAGDGVLPS